MSLSEKIIKYCINFLFTIVSFSTPEVARSDGTAISYSAGVSRAKTLKLAHDGVQMVRLLMGPVDPSLVVAGVQVLGCFRWKRSF